MSHNVETMAYAGQVPWHGLGKKVLADLTPDQMLVEAGLDWTVERTDLFYNFAGEQKTVTGNRVNKQALVRSSDGTVLDVVSDGWFPLQNSEAFQFFNEFVMAGDMEMHTAGSLKDGQLVWGLAKVNESFEVVKDDVVDQYLLFTNPHKFGSAIDVRMTPIRVVCNNTLSLALNAQKKNSQVKVNHRKAFDPDYVKKTLGVAQEKLGTYREVAQFLASKRYNDTSVVEFFNEVFPTLAKAKDGEEAKVSRNSKTAFEILETQPGADFAKGSWWSAFNSVTFMTDHLLGHEADTRMQSAWYGVNRDRKEAALEKAVAFAEAA